MSSKKYQYLAKNTILFSISSFGTKILSFFLLPIYTSLLTTEDYGKVDLITTTASLFLFLFTINISDAVLRFAIERKEKQQEIFNYGLHVITVGSVILGILILAVSQIGIFNWEKNCYYYLFLFFFTSALHSLISNYLRAIDRVDAIVVSSLLTTIVTIGFNILFLVFFRLGMEGYLLANILGSSVSIAYSFGVAKLDISNVIKNKCDAATQKAMKKYSIPLIFNSLAWWMNSSLDKYLVTMICGVTQNGIYAVSYKIPTLLTFFNSIFSQAWNLSAIREFDPIDKDGFFSRTYEMYNAGLVLMCSFLILVNIPLARFLYAKDFFEAWQYSSVLLISIIFSALSSFLGSIFSAVKDSKIFSISTICAAAINLVFNILMIPCYGAQGAAIATAISFFIMWLLRLICVRKYVMWKLNFKKDFCGYFLILLQVIFEHFEGGFYLGQCVIVGVLWILYGKQFWKFGYRLISKT